MSDVRAIMGMEAFLNRLPLGGIENRVRHYTPERNPNQTTSKSHGDFDNDETTMNTMLSFVLGRRPKRLFKEEDLSGY